MGGGTRRYIQFIQNKGLNKQDQTIIGTNNPPSTYMACIVNSYKTMSSPTEGTLKVTIPGIAYNYYISYSCIWGYGNEYSTKTGNQKWYLIADNAGMYWIPSINRNTEDNRLYQPFYIGDYIPFNISNTFNFCLPYGHTRYHSLQTGNPLHNGGSSDPNRIQLEISNDQKVRNSVAYIIPCRYQDRTIQECEVAGRILGGRYYIAEKTKHNFYNFTGVLPGIMIPQVHSSFGTPLVMEKDTDGNTLGILFNSNDTTDVGRIPDRAYFYIDTSSSFRTLG